MKIHHHILKSLTISAAVVLIPAAATAEIIGIEHFDYADGPVAGQSGGQFWDWSENTASPTHTGTSSDWDSVGGSPAVTGGSLSTQNSSAKREFNGPGEGVTAPSDERDGAFNGDDVIYFRTTMTRQAGASWSGLSSYDFGAERLFFGVPFSENPASMQREFGLQIAGVSPAYSGTTPVDGQTYDLVAKLDFGADLLSLWVDPDLSTDEVSNTPAATVAYTGTN